MAADNSLAAYFSPLNLNLNIYRHVFKLCNSFKFLIRYSQYDGRNKYGLLRISTPAHSCSSAVTQR